MARHPRGQGPWRGPARLTLPGLERPLRMATHPRAARDRFISVALREQGAWEPFQSQLVLQVLQPGQVCVDVGANLGYYSLLAATRVGATGQVHAFEPDPANVDLLRRNLRLNGLEQVRVYPSAVGDQAGPATLFRSPDNQGDQRLFAFQPGQAALEVPVCRLDDLPELAGAVHLLKVDAQGWEVKILRGAARLLAAMRGRGRLLLECWPHGLRGAGDTAEQLLRPLEQQGWRLAVVEEHSRTLRPIAAGELLRELEQPWFTQQQGFCNLWLE